MNQTEYPGKTAADIAWDECDVSGYDIVEVENRPMKRLKNDVFVDWE
jgi:hypothetical protein